MTIKILGSGCKNCIALYDNTKEALTQLGIEAEVVKLTDFKEIMTYGVMYMPVLVVDEKVVSYGKVLGSKEIINILNKAGNNQNDCASGGCSCGSGCC